MIVFFVNLKNPKNLIFEYNQDVTCLELRKTYEYFAYSFREIKKLDCESSIFNYFIPAETNLIICTSSFKHFTRTQYIIQIQFQEFKK